MKELTEKDLALMDAYLKGEMSIAEQQNFEQKLQSDVEFANQFNEIKLLKRAYFEQDQESIRTLMDKWDQEYLVEEKLPDTNFNWKWVGGIAASLILVLVATFFFLKQPSNDVLFADNFEPYKLVLTNTRGHDAEEDKLLEEAYRLYEQGNFEEASRKFKHKLRRQKSLKVQFYLGVSYLASGNATDAITVFQDCLEKDSLLKAQVHWYLGLAYLKNNDVQNAKKEFQWHIDEESSYKDEASTILSRIE